MNAKELAQQLNDCAYPCRPPKALIEQAKAAGLVIVFGYSDDVMEFRGAIDDQLDSYDGTTAYLDSKGLLQNDCGDHRCPHFQRLKEQAVTIDALWEGSRDTVGRTGPISLTRRLRCWTKGHRPSEVSCSPLRTCRARKPEADGRAPSAQCHRRAFFTEKE
ncbi:hypothetical protein [Paraburkholderia sp. UCT31]|uniref:hypothetical protein n=1 Tax=Paraburkholderia sp. UCT31 TaxID=2615209 RepID=UPI001CA402AE|nr:hypothetical protein [Paraburkholderia sp. UCT31]